MSRLCTVVLDFSPQFEWNSVYDQDRLWVSSCLCCFACNKPKLFLSRQSGENFGAGNLWSACKSGVCMSLHWICSVLYVLNGVKHVGPNFQVLGSSTISADWKPIWAFCSLKYYLFVCFTAWAVPEKGSWTISEPFTASSTVLVRAVPSLSTPSTAP